MKEFAISILIVAVFVLSFLYGWFSKPYPYCPPCDRATCAEMLPEEPEKAHFVSGDIVTWVRGGTDGRDVIIELLSVELGGWWTFRTLFNKPVMDKVQEHNLEVAKEALKGAR